MRLFPHIRRFKCSRRRFLLFIIIIIMTVGGYSAWMYWPYLYEVAHGELPCFASEIERKQLSYMLFAFHKLMTDNNYTYWIDYGTLLGSVRKSGFIPYDHDADLGYLLNDMKNVGAVVAGQLQKQYGIRLDVDRPVQMRYGQVRVDMFVYGTYQQRDLPLPDEYHQNGAILTRQFYRLSEFFEKTYADTDPNDVFPTKLCPFDSGWLSCPRKPDKVLKRRYPYTYSWNLRVPFKLNCYLNVFDFIRVFWSG